MVLEFAWHRKARCPPDSLGALACIVPHQASWTLFVLSVTRNCQTKTAIDTVVVGAGGRALFLIVFHRDNLHFVHVNFWCQKVTMRVDVLSNAWWCSVNWNCAKRMSPFVCRALNYYSPTDDWWPTTKFAWGSAKELFLLWCSHSPTSKFAFVHKSNWRRVAISVKNSKLSYFNGVKRGQ